MTRLYRSIQAPSVTSRPRRPLEYERHLRQVRGEYARAVERMTDAVTGHFPAGTRVSRPAGGFVIWIELPFEPDAFALARKALAAGVSIAPGPIFSATGKYRNCLRLSCACAWNKRVEEAVATLGRMVAETASKATPDGGAP